MSTITLAGSVSSALAHFALYGLARLAEQTRPGQVRLWWSSEAVPRPQLAIDGASARDLAELLRNQAAEWSATDAWPQIQREYRHGTKTASMSPFSPRIKPIDAEKNPGEWAEHQSARTNVLDELTRAGDWLSLELISALGEPAYWRHEKKDPRPDHGASRWEMKTRNRGEEFVTNRLGPMCREVTSWDVEKIADGITGTALDDTIGKNSASSRTSTGFTPPGPTDVAVAFAALLGIASFPMARKVHRINVTPGAFPGSRLHPTAMVLPVPTAPVSVARMENLLASEQLATCVEISGSRLSDSEVPEEQELAAHEAAQWLRSRTVPAVVAFPILLTGSTSAPERQVQNGQIHLL